MTPDTGTIAVAYAIIGGEDELIDTFTVSGDEITYTETEDLPTPSSRSKLNVKVTDALYSES